MTKKEILKIIYSKVVGVEPETEYDGETLPAEYIFYEKDLLEIAEEIERKLNENLAQK